VKLIEASAPEATCYSLIDWQTSKACSTNTWACNVGCCVE